MVRLNVREVGPSVGVTRSTYSNYLITINGNRRPRTNAQALMDAADLRRGIRALLSSGGIERIVHAGPYVHEHPPRYTPNDWDDNHITNVRAEFAIERGVSPRGGRIHAHIVLKIDHTTRTRVDVDEIKGVIAENSTITNAYVNVRLLGRTAEDYIRKTALRPVVQQ